MNQLSLNGSDWRLDGFWINQWRIGPTSALSRPMVPSIPATVPGAVHADLRAAGWIPDWQNGSSSFDSEWVNNRDWRLSRAVHVPADFEGSLSLEFDGLDYSGTVSIDGQEIGEFEGTHLRHRFDLPHIKPGQVFQLSVMFTPAPSLDGQIGWTSKTRIFKPRFGYWWDWCSRIINVGIWQDVRLVSRGAVRLENVRVLPRVDDLKTGRVSILGHVAGGNASARYELKDNTGNAVVQNEAAIRDGDLRIVFPVNDVRLWWPATHGDQPLYDLKVELVDASGEVSDRIERTIGFKRVCWLDNPGASKDARPYWCEINGHTIFLRGVNWIPPSPLYGTVKPEDYEAFLRQYRHMHANILRVWGGAVLEKPSFYEWCDKLGLLVWQEFPLSSSGLDSSPPTDPATIAELKRIATEFIERRGHHASHLLWCGGNELQKKAIVDGKEEDVPIDEGEPLMKEWIGLIDTLDPGKRFLATSSTGPRFYAFARNFGKGLHHDIHGPWANIPLSERYAYWNNDDALLRSEVGAPGCASMSMLERHCDGRLSNRASGVPATQGRDDTAASASSHWRRILWPCRIDNPAWLVPASTWVPSVDVAREFGEIKDDPSQLETLVKASRYLQAESYRYVAEAVRRNYPHTSGFMIWCGHDMVHCTCNNSVIEVAGSTKPAFDWLRLAFQPRHVSLRTDSISFPPGSSFVGRVWLSADLPPDSKYSRQPHRGQLVASLIDMEGRVLEKLDQDVKFVGPSAQVASLDWKIPQLPQPLFVVALLWKTAEGEISNRYLFTQQIDHPLAPLLALRQASLLVESISNGKVRVSNGNHIAAVGVRLIRPGHLIASPNHFILLPGETQTIDFEIPGQAPTGSYLQVECFNGPTVGVAG